MTKEEVLDYLKISEKSFSRWLKTAPNPPEKYHLINSEVLYEFKEISNLKKQLDYYREKSRNKNISSFIKENSSYYIYNIFGYRIKKHT